MWNATQLFTALPAPSSAAAALLLCVYAVHAAGDCLCTVGTLFRDMPWARALVACGALEGFYPQTFVHAHAREDPLTARLLIYFVAAMSLVRVVAVCMPTSSMCVCVGLMYLLQGLAAEYEGFTSKSTFPPLSRLVSSVCFAMATASFLLACTF